MKKLFLFIFCFLAFPTLVYACTSTPGASCNVDSDCCAVNNLVCFDNSFAKTCANPTNAACANNYTFGSIWYATDGAKRQCASNQICITQSGGSRLIPCFAPTPTPTPEPTLIPCGNVGGSCIYGTCPPPAGHHTDALRFSCPFSANPDFQTYCCVPNNVPTITPTPTLLPCPGTCATSCSLGYEVYNPGIGYCKETNSSNVVCCLKCNLNLGSCSKNIDCCSGYCSQTENPPRCLAWYSKGTPPPDPTITPLPPRPACSKYASNGDCIQVNTAIGNVSLDDNGTGFVGSLFGILLGFSGGIAILLIIYSGIRLITSQANPEKIQQSREILTAAIVGLLFIIFSVVILEVIGIDILHIPGISR